MRQNRLRTLFNELTTVKLSLQLLRRRTDYCRDPDGLLDKALGATDDVIGELREDATVTSSERSPLRGTST